MSRKEESPLVLLTRRVKVLYLSTVYTDWGIGSRPQIGQTAFSRCFNKAASEYGFTTRQRQTLMPLVRDSIVQALESLHNNQIKPLHTKPTGGVPCQDVPTRITTTRFVMPSSDIWEHPSIWTTSSICFQKLPGNTTSSHTRTATSPIAKPSADSLKTR